MGNYNPSNGQMEIHNEKMVEDQDLLDLAAYHTILTGGTVYVIDPDRIPRRRAGLCHFQVLDILSRANGGRGVFGEVMPEGL